MAGINPKRQSYFLTVEPVKYSLTDGTNIPPPPESPPLPPPARAPQQHADPLSHPGVNGMPGAFPTDEENNNNTAATQHARKSSISTVGTLENPLPPTANNNGKLRHRADSFQTPLSPSSASTINRPAVRRMFSLTSLRQSFSSSRTSLALPRSSHDPYSAASRPQSPSAASTLASVNGDPRAGGSSSSKTRQKRSSGWFRRRSSFFHGGNDAMLDVVDEDPREAKRLKDAATNPAPLLPEVGTLKGGRLDNGNLGWDDGMFNKAQE